MFGALAGDAEDMSTEHESGLRLWEAKYRFRKDMLPMFVGEAFGKKVSKIIRRATQPSKIGLSVDLFYRKEPQLYPIQLSRQ